MTWQASPPPWATSPLLFSLRKTQRGLLLVHKTIVLFEVVFYVPVAAADFKCAFSLLEESVSVVGLLLTKADPEQRVWMQVTYRERAFRRNQ